MFRRILLVSLLAFLNFKKKKKNQLVACLGIKLNIGYLVYGAHRVEINDLA